MVEERLPHRMVHEMSKRGDEALRQLSESVSSALDHLPLGRAGPHRIIDAITKGATDIRKEVGETITQALDVPPKTPKEVKPPPELR